MLFSSCLMHVSIIMHACFFTYFLESLLLFLDENVDEEFE